MKIAIIMDPLSQLKPYKDSTVAIILEAQKRAHTLFHIHHLNLFCENAQVYANAQPMVLNEGSDDWYKLGTLETHSLNDFDLVLMRKDPPFDTEYLYATYLLSLAQSQGAQIINHPNGLRTANEKLFTQYFPDLLPPTLITSNLSKLKAFIAEHEDVVLKPLNEMGGNSIFHLKKDSDNCAVVLEWMTQGGRRSIMSQRFIPEILKTGDKRITLFAGKPAVPYALARIPSQGDFRGNLAVGGIGIGVPLNKRDYEICEAVGPTLMKEGLIWAGIDVIGDYLTEINVTSPTGIRELDTQFNLNISAVFWDWVEKNISV
jgi:glutathione synthase